MRLILTAIAVFGVLICPAYAARNVEAADFAVVTDGYDYEGSIISVEGTAYVSLREFACMADNSVVKWDSRTDTAYVRTDSLELTAREGDDMICANGRLLWCRYGVFTYDDTMYVPLSAAAKAFGFDTEYSFEDNTTYLTRLRGVIEDADTFYDADELYWLSRIINAEAEGEPFDGKLAVGNVIMNRVESDSFPDTVYDVIFDNHQGVQFTPTVNGRIYEEPGEDSVIAAKLCLDGAQMDDGILYFLNEAIATSLWVPQNCLFVMSIGEHDFYS